MATVQTARPVTLDNEMTEQFRSTLRGRLLLPDDDGYDAARAIWNGMIDKRPALIVQPAGVADVISAVNFAREHEILLAIKSGGHNVAGSGLCDDGLVLDMSSMRAVRINPQDRTAYVEGGAQWGDLDQEAAAFNLVTTGGVVSTTGVAGLTLGGGIGWLNAKFGAACDNVLAYDIVLANGDYVRASAEEHQDLFWALKGGGGNFGVVTGFVFQMYPFDGQVLAGARFYPLEKARDVLEFYRQFTTKTSNDVIVYCANWINPATGAYATAIAFCHSGGLEAAEREMAPVRAFGDAELDIISPMPYTAWQQAFNPLNPDGRNYYWKALLFTDLTDDVLDIVAQHGAQRPTVTSFAIFEQFGGVYSQPGKTEMAFWPREARYQLVISGSWDDPTYQEPCIAWARGLHDALAPHAMNGRNLNFAVVEEGERADRVRASHGDNYDRLVQIKTKYDPSNLFRVNNNIRPAV
ncbi:MAG: FAD-binding oxidoreductase [Chloroflexota bacterium]|nr:FAD-binding oxidoreductase [Chloroflexota bacterium]